jgi:excisionase family DNA binding protein
MARPFQPLPTVPNVTSTRKAAPTRRAPPYPDWIADAVASLPPIARIEEVAAVIRMSRHTILRLIARGQLRAVKGASASGPARVLIPRAEVARYLQSLEDGTSWRRDASRVAP